MQGPGGPGKEAPVIDTVLSLMILVVVFAALAKGLMFNDYEME